MEIFEWRLQLMISVAAETALLPLAAHLLPLATAVCSEGEMNEITSYRYTKRNNRQQTIGCNLGLTVFKDFVDKMQVLVGRDVIARVDILTSESKRR